MKNDIFECPTCGNHCSDKDYVNDTADIVCPKCGRCWRDEKKYKSFERDLKEAEILLDSEIPDFVRAFEKYNILSKQLGTADAYWKKFLSKRFVKLQADSDGVLHPTCFGSSYDPIDGDPDFLKACDDAGEEKKSEYKRIADEINKAYEKLIELQQNPHHFDLFISFKSGTTDEKYAEKLYEELTKSGKIVFFSPKLNQIYNGSEAPSEAIIYDALMNSAGFVIVSSTSDCFTKDSWVKNEWERFLYKMTHDPDKDKKYYFDCVSPNADIYREVPPSIKTCTDSKNFIVIGKDDSYIRIIKERLNKYVGSSTLLFSDPPKVHIDRDRISVKKNVTKTLGRNKKCAINIDRSEEQNFYQQISFDKGDIRRSLDIAYDDLAKGSGFTAAATIFKKIYQDNPSNIRAAFGLLLTNKRVTDVVDLTNEQLKKFDSDEFDVLKQAIFYFSSDDKLQIGIQKKDKIETKILKRLCLFLKECVKEPKLYNYNSCICALKCIVPFRENDFLKEFIDDIFDAFDNCKKMPNEDNYFDFIKNLLECSSNEAYKDRLQQIIRTSIDSNAKELVSSLLEYYKSLCEEDGFYLDSKIRYEQNLKEFDDFVLYLLRNNKIETLGKIVDSLSEKEGNIYLEKLYDLLQKEFANCKNKLNYVGELAKLIFGYKFDNYLKKLDEFVTKKLITSPIMECNQLIIDLVVPNFEDDDEIFLLGLRYRYLCSNNKGNYALEFVRSACKENPYVYEYHEWELNLLLKTNDAAKKVDMKDILTFDKNNNAIVFMSSLSRENKDKNELVEKTDAIVRNICVECIKSLKKYRSKADDVIGYFNYFAKFISNKNKKIRCDCFKYAVEECLKNKIFSVTINNMNIIQFYCNFLIAYSNKLLIEGEYVEDLVEYYIYLMQVANKAKTKLDLINIPCDIQTESNEYKQMLALVDNHSRYKKELYDFRELVVIPQSKILEKRKQRRD